MSLSDFNFTPDQVDEIFGVLEKHGVDIEVSYPQASKMLSDVLIETCRQLDTEQAQKMWDSI